MRTILFINTGGTISSAESEKGRKPETDASELLSLVPSVRAFCDVDGLSLFSLDSTDIAPGNWLTLANIVKENYNKYDGFVIAHGTDTMAYTAAALSYLIRNNAKPVVLTGSQIPALFPGSDAPENLRDAFSYAASGRAQGTTVVFAGHVIRGDRVRKRHTGDPDSMESANAEDLARIENGRIKMTGQTASPAETAFRGSSPEKENVSPAAACDFHQKKAAGSGVVFFERLKTNVGLVKNWPGKDAGLAEYALNRYDALVLETFGTGGLPAYSGLYPLLSSKRYANRPVVVATQVPGGGTDVSRYQVGRPLLSLPNVFEAGTRTTEACVVKLMWLLPLSKDLRDARRLFEEE